MALDRYLYLLRTYRWLASAWRLAGVPQYRIDRPIFLLGTQGGGLSLLSRMLRRHPLTISTAGNCDYWTSSDEMANTFGLLLPPEFTGLRYKAPHHPVYTPPRSWTYACDELIGAYRKSRLDASPRLASELTKAIRFAALLYAKDKSHFRFVDKSQTTTVRLGLFYECLHDCDPRFILVARDPYVAIYRAATGKAGDMQRLSGQLSLAERVRVCTEHYMNSMRAVFQDSDNDHIAVHSLRLEDLLREPERSVREVCDFVDLEFNDQMLPRPEHRLPWGSRFRDRWWPLRADVNAGYQHRIEQWMVREVNERGGDVVERLGYEVLD